MVNPSTWWRRHAGISLRSALAATVVVGVVLTVSAVLLVAVLESSLNRGIQAQATQRAQDIALEVSTESSEGRDRSVAGTGGDAQVAQIIDVNGIVLNEAPSLRGEPAMTDLRPAPGHVLTTTQPRLPGADDGPYLVAAVGVRSSTGPLVVAVAQSLSPVQQSVDAVTTLLGIGLPVLLALVGGATFVFVRRSLRPVEAIRARVAQIGFGELAERVPVPEVQDEVHRLAETMNRMLARLQESRDDQRRFVADASHELRSPLATLGAVLDVAAAEPEPREWPDLLADLRAEIDRMARLVADLLLLAEVDERRLRLAVHEVDLDDVVAAEARRVRTTTNLHVRARIFPVRVVSDPHRLGQAVRNLVDNASRHAASTVELTLRAEGDQAVLEVADDGRGIPAGERERVFQRFVRLDESRVRTDDGTGGSGLGLAIVREVVAASGGRVMAAERPGGGALFRVELPLAVVATPTDVGDGAAVEVGAAQPPSASSR